MPITQDNRDMNNINFIIMGILYTEQTCKSCKSFEVLFKMHFSRMMGQLFENTIRMPELKLLIFIRRWQFLGSNSGFPATMVK